MCVVSPQVFAIFLICSFAYPKLVLRQNIHWFQALYYLSSFFGLFGSHTTSFLLSGALTEPTFLSITIMHMQSGNK